MRRSPQPILGVLLLVALHAGACGAPRTEGDGPRSGVLRTEELPPRERQAWEAWQRGGGRWELAREEVRRDPELVRFLVDNLVRELVKSYDRSRLSRPGEQPGPFERAGAELVRLAPQSAPVLAEMLALRDGIVAFLAADLLVRIGVLGLEPVSAKLAHPEVEVRRRAAELLGRLPHGGESEARFEKALGRLAEKDPAWIVRAQAAGALGARGARHTHKGYAAGVLARCLADADASVAESAARGLRELAEPRVIPILIDALERNSARGDLAALRATRETLYELSGEKRDRSPEEWRRWWSEVGERKLVH